MRFGRKNKDEGGTPAPPVNTPGAPAGLPPEFVEARAFLTEISRSRRNSLFSASAGMGFDELAAGLEILTAEMEDAWRHLESRKHSLLIQGPSGSGKTAILRWLAYRSLVDLREPAHFYEVESTCGKRELEAASAAPGILFLDNAQRNRNFAKEVAKRRAKGTTVTAAHPPDDPASEGFSSNYTDLGLTIGVRPDHVAKQVWQGAIRPLLTKPAYEEFEREIVYARLDLWSTTWAVDGCVDHARRFGALTAADVMRLARERATDWLRRGLPGIVGAREVASVLLPVTVFSQYEIPVPREFILTQFALDPSTFSKLVAFGEIAVVNENVGLHHRSLARLYASAIRSAPDLLALTHPSIRGEQVAPTFAALAKRHPESVLDALARFSQAGGAARAQALIDDSDIRRALLVALDDAEVVRRAIPAIQRLARDIQRLVVRPPDDVVRALSAAACTVAEGPEGPERSTGIDCVGALAHHLLPEERSRSVAVLLKGMRSADFATWKRCAGALALTARIAPTVEREEIVDALLAASTAGDAHSRKFALWGLKEIGPWIPPSRDEAVIDALVAATLSPEEDVYHAASSAFTWLFGLAPHRHEEVVAQLSTHLPRLAMDAQNNAMRIILELTSSVLQPTLDGAVVAVFDVARNRAAADLYYPSSFLADLAKAGRLSTRFVDPAVRLALALSATAGRGEDAEEDDLPVRAAADDLGAYPRLILPALIGPVTERLVELLESPYESYKWGDDAITRAADTLLQYFPVMDRADAENRVRKIIGLFQSARDRVREVAVIVAGQTTAYLGPAAQRYLFGALAARVTDEESLVSDAAVDALSAWVPTMPAAILDVLGLELDRAAKGHSKWERSYVFKLAAASLPVVPPAYRRAALDLCTAELREGAEVDSFEAVRALSGEAKAADPSYLAWLAGWIAPSIHDTRRENAAAALRFVLTNRTRLDPALVRAGLDSLVKRCAVRDPWGASDHSLIALELAREGDPAVAPHLDVAATYLCLGPPGFLNERGIEIAACLPPSPPRSPPSELPAAIAVVLEGEWAPARARTARLLAERPDLCDAAIREGLPRVFREVAMGAVDALRGLEGHERSRAADVLRMFGPSIPEELALEVLATIEELTNCQVEGLRLSAFEALKACAPSIPPAERARVSMIIVRAAASADAQTGRAALNALEPYIDAIPPTSRAEAIVLLLDGRGLQIRWSTRERIAALYALRDAIPDERRATLNAAIGNWKSGDKPPRYGP